MIAGIGTWAGLVTAVCTMVIALFTLAITITARRSKRTVEQTHKQTIEIHQIVNQQRTDMQRYQKVLENALAAHGIDIPDDQSKIDTKEVSP
jgi:uncharacterized membrane protein YhiD involved in acid resistance